MAENNETPNTKPAANPAAAKAAAAPAAAKAAETPDEGPYRAVNHFGTFAAGATFTLTELKKRGAGVGFDLVARLGDAIAKGSVETEADAVKRETAKAKDDAEAAAAAAR